MKIKRWIAIAMLAGAGLSAFGEYLERWEFNDASSVNLNGMANSGSLGTSWSWGDTAKWHTDDAGSLVVPGGPGNDYKAANAYASPLVGAGVYSFEMKISSWEMDAAMAGSALKYRLVNNYGGGDKYLSEIRFEMKSDGSGAIAKMISGHTNYRDYDIGGLTGGVVTVRIDFDMHAGTAEYFVDDESKATFSNLDTDLMTAGINQVKMSREGGWGSAGTALNVDELSLSFVADDPPKGALIIDRVVSADTVAASTNVVKTFDALAGDIIVVVSASTSKDEPSANSVAIATGGTATIDPVVDGQANPYAACSTRYWYTTVTADGTVPVELTRTGGAYWSAGAYQIRAAAGYTNLTLLGSPLENKLDAVSSITNNYTISSTNYIGVYVEALSAAGTGYWYTDDSEATVSYGNQDKRNIAVGSFSNVSAIENVWSSTNISQVTSVGLAFGATTGAGPSNQEKYDTWLSGYSVGTDTDMADDADGDQLDNLTEYAFGGEPDNAAHQGNTPVQSIVNDGGTDYIEYIYYERDNAAALGLASIFEFGTDLVITNWTDATSYETGRGAGPTDFTAITNRIPTDVEAKQFIKLQIKFAP